MSNTITATFKNRLSAEDALRRLETAGVSSSQVSIMMSEDTRGRHFAIKENTKVDEGAAVGATVGGLVGAAIAAVTTSTAMVIPGLNVIVTGALLAAFAGGGAGALTGGFVGALIGADIPEHEAKLYETEISRGSVLVAVQALNDDQKKVIKDILKQTEAANIAA